MATFNKYNDDIDHQNTIKAFSMKKKIIINTLLGFLVLFLTVGVSASFYLVKWLNKEFDQNLNAKTRILMNLVNAQTNGVEFDFTDEFMPEFGLAKNTEYFQLWHQSGETLEKSKSFNLLPTESQLPVSDFNSFEEHFSDVTLPNGKKGRMVSISFIPQTVETYRQNERSEKQLPILTLAIAKERESLDKTIRDFLSIFIAIVILFTLIAAVTIWQMVTKGLLPLKTMQRKMSILAMDNLSERLTLPSTPKELEETVDQFNLMMDRLEHSFQREKHFTSEVAEELNMPIAKMRQLAEAAIEDQHNPSYFKEILDSSIEIQLTVSNLMALAKCDKGNIVLEPTVIKLAGKLNSCWDKYKDLSAKNNINYINEVENKFKIISSSSELDMIFDNLFFNAIDNGIEGDEIKTYIRTSNDILCVCFQSKPKKLDLDELDMMFNRSWDSSISGKLQGNSSLGLALVKSYSDLLGLKITTCEPAPGVLLIELRGLYQDH